LATDSAPSEHGSAPTLAELFTAHAGFVWSLLRRLGVRVADVEDVSQEVFVVAHRRLPSFEPRANPRTWLYGIAVRVASDYRRSARIRREELAASPPEPSLDAPQESALNAKRGLAWLDEVLEQLDDDKRAVFVLYEIEQLTMSEIAPIVGAPLQTAYSRLHAARKHVQAAASARRRAQEDDATSPDDREERQR
jgi:RNA polymerase sigma-70 factor (ECF subfamily)